MRPPAWCYGKGSATRRGPGKGDNLAVFPATSKGSRQSCGGGGRARVSRGFQNYGSAAIAAAPEAADQRGMKSRAEIE